MSAYAPEQTSYRMRLRFSRNLLSLLAIIGLAYGMTKLEKLLGFGEVGLGKHPEWTSLGYSEELESAKLTHQTFCHLQKSFRWDKIHDLYAESHQRKFTENYLGMMCVVSYSWRSRDISPEFREILSRYHLDSSDYFQAIKQAHFDFRWTESEAQRKRFFEQSDHVLSDPEQRRRLLVDLSDWYRSKNGRRRIGLLTRFASWFGSHDAFIHESGQQAAFQSYTYSKQGKRAGWAEQTQFLELQHGVWKVTDFEVRLLEEAPAGVE